MSPKKAALIICSILVACLSGVSNAQADVKIEELSTVVDEFTVGMEVHVFYRIDDNPYFGAEKFPDGDDSTNWAEIAARTCFTAKKNIGWTELSAQLAPVYLSTIDQDVFGVYKNTDSLEVDRAWLKFSDLLGSFDVTVGMQDIDFEKMLLVSIARSQDAALWLPIHDSWPFAVRLDGEIGPVKATAFWGKTKDYVAGGGGFGPPHKDDIEGAGLNVHYDLDEGKYVYGGVVMKMDNGSQSGRAEQNTQVFNMGFDMTFGAISIEGEIAYQTGDVKLLSGVELDRDAFGGVIRAMYKFPVKFDPYIKLHYIYLPGDSDSTDGDMEEWDPMFWGFPRWNYQVIGELVGEAHLIIPNANKNDWIVEVGFTPVMPCFVSLSYINHNLDENYVSLGEGAFIPVSDDHWADEFNLFVDLPVHDNLFMHLGLGYVIPGDAAEEYLGSDNDAVFAQVWIRYSF